MRASSEDESARLPVEVTVKVKANMQFKKIFEVAEVRARSLSTWPRALTISLYFPPPRNGSAKTLVRSSPVTLVARTKGNDLEHV
jgi:hypothetical protein